MAETTYHLDIATPYTGDVIGAFGRAARSCGMELLAQTQDSAQMCYHLGPLEVPINLGLRGSAAKKCVSLDASCEFDNEILVADVHERVAALLQAVRGDLVGPGAWKSGRSVLAEPERNEVAIPAPEPPSGARGGAGMLAGMALGGLAGPLGAVMGANLGGSSAMHIDLDKEIVVPARCGVCGDGGVATHSVVEARLAHRGFADTGVGLSVPVCQSCRGLPIAPGVQIVNYAQDRGQWKVTLRIGNAAVAKAYAEKNHGEVAGDQRDRSLLAIIQPRQGKVVMVIGGKEGQGYADLEPRVALSPDGTRNAYWARKDGRWCAVVDGVEGQSCDKHGSIAFSPDGRHVAYSGQKGKKWVVATDGVEGPEFDDVGRALAISPATGRAAYAAREKGDWVLMLDGSESARYKAVEAEPFGFSPDGQHFVCGATVAGRWTTRKWIVLDGQQLGGMLSHSVQPDSFRWSPDSSGSVFCMSPDQTGSVAPTPMSTFFVNGAKTWTHRSVSAHSIRYSADGGHILHEAKDWRKGWVSMVDGVPLGNRAILAGL